MLTCLAGVQIRNSRRLCNDARPSWVSAVDDSVCNCWCALQMCTCAAAGGTAPAPAPAEELPCGSASGASASASKPLLGGYSLLNLTTAPLVTQQLVPLAWQSYAGSNAVGGCAAGTARLSSAYVKRACQQVRHQACSPYDLCYCLADLCREQRHGVVLLALRASRLWRCSAPASSYGLQPHCLLPLTCLSSPCLTQCSEAKPPACLLLCPVHCA